MDLPAYYGHLVRNRLGRYADLLCERDLIPVLWQPSAARTYR